MYEILKNTGQIIALVSVIGAVWLMFSWKTIDPTTFLEVSHPARFVVGLTIIGGGAIHLIAFTALARMYEATVGQRYA